MKKYILVSFLFLAACAPKHADEATTSIAKDTVESLSCEDFQSSVWDGVKNYLQQQQTLPSVYDMSLALKQQLTQLQDTHPDITQDQINALTLDLNALFTAILEEAPSGEKASTPQQLLILLSAIDVGDKTTAFRAYMVNKTTALFAQVNADIQGLGLACPKPAAQNDGFTYERHQLTALQSGLPLAVFGERWAFATAYQSCNTLRLPAMTAQTPDVKGISIVGTHPDGVGSKRMITSLSSVQSTHYYVKDERSYGSACFNVRNNPLIYDYGGKPYATTAADSRINLFKDNGDGTSVLGIDCSGFVFTSMAAAGLKLKATRALKASDSWAWGSSSYVEPQQNGLTCLDKITMTPTDNLRAGDIVAIYGHVFMIDSVGADPFGIGKTRSLSDCAKMSAKNFDFVIAQSSNSKNGIGINHYDGAAYVSDHGGTIQTEMVKYANYACQAYYNKKNYTPSLGDLSIVRHKGTSECMATRVKLTNEECIQDCQEF